MVMKAQCAVTFKLDHQELKIQADKQSSVLELALDHDLQIEHSCGGFATCGTCRVFVEKAVEKLAPREGLELEMAQDRGFAANERLCCQLFPVDGLVLRVPKASQ